MSTLLSGSAHCVALPWCCCFLLTSALCCLMKYDGIAGKRNALRKASLSLTCVRDVVSCILGGMMNLGETVLSLKHSVYGVVMVGRGNIADNRTWRSLDNSISGRGSCMDGNTNVETRNLFPPKRVSQRMRITFSHPVQSKLTDSVCFRCCTLSTVITQID